MKFTPAVSRKMTFEEWEEKYKPIKNPFSKYVDDYMLETYGRDLDFVKSHDAHHIWTDLACDGYNWIENGVYRVNRLGYYVTEIPWEDGELFYIELSTPEDEDEG
jgi:hypothetical protein